ncbi:energy-coupling factor transporter transmembrane component T family protein [Nocardia arthritidis]|uniref:Energy-coupling factor transporter transmembrane protein EcfT n=1 Tax=Nocardia arthritidis TaxID=228602 RepID=A0A6G9Y6G4_9NOCA|nr:energy-coupling factor transporter transmembrane protein EcfT [Nocardia arthritidis]QIS08677.1 energy-coupling factor transporter transmembrane protein EcfT [Nocardia arthritidis]
MSTVLLREVPVASPVHSLWAGTKMIAVFLISLVLMFWPSWPVLGLMVIFLAAVCLTARLPLGTLPRLPLWFWGLLIFSGLTTVPAGVDAVIRYVQVVLFGLMMVAASFIVAWTTPMGEIAPALATLGAPLRKLRVPVDEWAVVIALTLRGLPLLLEEMRVLRAARKLRPKDSFLYRAADNPMIDLLTAAMAVSTRRAGELGEAITARGGTGQLTAHPTTPGRADAIALGLVIAVCLAAVTSTLLL